VKHGLLPGIISLLNKLPRAVGEYGDDPLATFHLTRTLAGETGINITLAKK
jgi:hypothetical protein